MSLPALALDPYHQSLAAFFLLVIPPGLYIMGMYEDKKGDALILAGLVVHATSILERWAYTGLVPLSEKHDNISLTAFIMAAVFLGLRRSGRSGGLSIYALPLICTLTFVAIGHRAYDTITPFIQTPWFYLHVLSYFCAYALFGLSAAACIGHIVTGQDSHEALGYRTASAGWVLLSASLLLGSIWFYMAYGTYWLWTSKELWISITWLYYTLYLHARLINRLRGKAASALALAGYAIALFTYFGVGTIIKAPPTQF